MPPTPLPEPPKQKPKEIIIDCDNTLDKDMLGHCPDEANPLSRDKTESNWTIDLNYFKFFSWFLISFIIADLIFDWLRSISKKYLEDYFRYALKIVMIEIGILLTFNSLIAILYYSSTLNFVFEEMEFELYPLCIAVAIFGCVWMMLVIIYIFEF